MFTRRSPYLDLVTDKALVSAAFFCVVLLLFAPTFVPAAEVIVTHEVFISVVSMAALWAHGAGQVGTSGKAKTSRK